MKKASSKSKNDLFIIVKFWKWVHIVGLIVAAVIIVWSLIEKKLVIVRMTLRDNPISWPPSVIVILFILGITLSVLIIYGIVKS